MSKRKEGCTSRLEKIATDTGMSSRSIKRLIDKLFKREFIDVLPDGKSKILFFNKQKFEQESKDNLSDNLSDTLVNDLDNLSKKGDNLSKNEDNLSPSYMEEPKGTNKEPIVEASSSKNFSVLKTDHEELKKYLLVKHRRELVNLLPTGSAEELAEEFATYWVGENRSFTNTRQQRDWVRNSLPLWAEIQKPKNESAGIAKIAKEVWKRDLPENELKLISKKVIAENWNDQELRQFMIFTSRNIPAPNGVNTWNVFQKHFENLKTQVA